MHDKLFESQNALAPFSAHATALGLDVARFDECMSSGKHAADVRKDMEQAQKAGATGTPSFVLGRTDPNNPSAVKGITFLRGARAFADFKVEIDRALSQAER
jgi:predicted DsbA family dithiol-disulfide isomerase